MSLCIGVSLGCTRQGKEASSIRLKLPNTGHAGKLSGKANFSQSLSQFWALSDPASLAEIDCYAVFVSAPDLPVSTCIDSSEVPQFSAGLIAGLYPAGSEVVVQVPSGPSRTIRLVGMKASSASICGLAANQYLPVNDLSAPFVLSSKTVDLEPGEKHIDMTATLVAGSKFHSCSGARGFGPANTGGASALTAVLAGAPSSASNATGLSVSVSGTGVSVYQYKVGLEPSVDCSVASGYSSDFPIASAISDDISGLGDGDLELCVIGGDGAGNYQSLAAATSYVWLKDTVAPTVAITSPTGGAYAYGANVSSYSVSGTCSEAGQNVILSGDASGSTLCSGSTWATTVDFSAASDGSVSLYADLLDLAGNAAIQASIAYNKDTVAPSSPTIDIDLGNANTFSTSVTVYLGASGAADMYVTNTLGCSAGGTWEALSGSKPWVLGGTNGVQTVYVKYRDAAGNESACVNDTITHMDPALITLSESDPYNYGTIAIGGSSTHVFTLTNSGGTSATGLGEAGLAAPFQFAGGSYPGAGGTCGTTLAMGASCDIVVEFAPVSASAFPDTIIINYNNGVSAVNATRDVLGTGASPASLAISDGPVYDYGIVATGSVNTKSFTVTNSGSVAATGMSDALGLAAPFSFAGGSYPGTAGTCGATLAAGGNCTIIVEYSPVGLGVLSDNIDLSYYDGASLQNVTRGVQGTGAAPASLTISEADPYDFGVQSIFTSNVHVFIINNSGGVAATGMVGAGLAAPFNYNGGSYPGSGGNCGTVLSAGGNCTIEVEYYPTIPSVDNDAIEISYNDGVNIQMSTRGVTGTGSGGGGSLVFMALGNEQSCGFDIGGNGYCWGRGTEGELGDGSGSNYTASVVISGGQIWSQMDSFTRTVCGVDTSNNGWCWGQNDSGQVGNGTTTNQMTPYQLPAAATWQKIVVGNQHSCGMKIGGTIQCWGKNLNGQLGDSSGLDSTTPVNVSGGATYTDLDTNGKTTCAIKNDGSIQCWGWGFEGQMGNSTTTQDNLSPVNSSLLSGTFTKIAVGGLHVCALDSSGNIKCWGKGNSGQLGDGTATDSWNALASVSGTNWTKIVAGDSHTCGLKLGTNELYCWGLNSAGQLGDGTVTQRNSPVLIGSDYADVFVGYSHTCGIKASGDLYCWGLNANSQLGDGSTSNSTSPLYVNP